MDYQEILEDYKLLQDNDGLSAYTIMKTADSLKYTLTEQMHNLEKQKDLLEVKCNAVKGAISVEHSPRDNASGNRYAAKDETYIALYEQFIELKFQYNLLSNKIWYLGNVSYRCYAIWDSCNKYFKGR